MWDLKWEKGGFIKKKISVLLNHTLVPHIHKLQDMYAQVICSAHSHHIVSRVLSKFSWSCLEDKGVNLLNPPPPLSWVLPSLEILAKTGLLCLTF